MKFTGFCLIIFTAFLNFSCGQNVESSPVAVNEKPAEMLQASPTPDEFEEIDLQQKFSKMENEDLPPSLKIAGYEIKNITVKKKTKKTAPKRISSMRFCRRKENQSPDLKANIIL